MSVIVTGASSGIGLAIAERYLKEGYSVFGLDKDGPTILDNAYHHRITDLNSSTEIGDAINEYQVSDENNVLVNAAGTREIVPLSNLSLDKWNDVLNLNLTAPFLLSKLFSIKIKDYGKIGNIINIASTSGVLGEPNRTAYVTSKHALIGLTKQLAIELGGWNIRANSISPGVIRTPLTESYYSNEVQIEKIKSGQFIGHMGTVRDIADIAYFIGKIESEFITGSNFNIDGGWTAGKNI